MGEDEVPPFGVAPSLLVVLAFVVSTAGAANAQTFEGARLLGLADSQRALTTQNDSIYLNPAGLALGSMYSLELGLLDDARGSDRRLNASIVDSQAGPIAGGVAYTYINRRPSELPTGDERLRNHRVELSLATRVAETAAFGLTGRFVKFERTIGDTSIPDSGFSEFTLDAGLQWRVGGNVSLGLVGYNLTNSKHPEIPISWGAGLGYLLNAFSIEADVRYNAQKGKALYSGGVGYVIAETVPLRAGVSYDLATESTSISVGAGLVIDKLQIDIGFRQRVNGSRTPDEALPRLFAVALRGTFL